MQVEHYKPNAWEAVGEGSRRKTVGGGSRVEMDVDLMDHLPDDAFRNR